MHGRATRTRAWCGHVHAHGKDIYVRVEMLSACAWLLTAQVYYWQICFVDPAALGTTLVTVDRLRGGVLELLVLGS